MDIELLVQDNKTGKAWDLSELAGPITWTTELSNQPGKLTFSYIEDKDVDFGEGSVVRLKVDGQNVFYGYVFSHGRTESYKITITAFDSMRYLKNKDTYVISGMTASDIFTKLCKDFNLPYTVTNSASYKISNRVFDNKSLFEIMETAIDETLIYTGKWFQVRDNFGKLQFVDLNSRKTTVVIGDESLLKSYSFESSIDSDTYNQVKLVQENKTSKKREAYIQKDSSTIKQWGVLQYFETMDENANAAQIKERAKMLLKLKNRVTKTLRLECIGNLSVSSGSGIVLSISDLLREGVTVNEYFLVTSCTHTFENHKHSMSLEVQVSI